MANLRIVNDNVADRATLSASSTAGGLVAANLQTDAKSVVWRSTGTAADLTATWANAETVSGVVLPFTNLTSNATIRVQGYTEPDDASPAFDTGAINAGAYPPLGNNANIGGANTFAFGRGSYARCWFAPAAVKKLVISLADPDNSAGYLEVSRLVVGNYWSPTYNAEYGVPLQMVESSAHQRTDSGDLRTDIGTRHKKLSLDLSLMPPADRTQLWEIMRHYGITSPIFISLFPLDSDVSKEQAYQLYGKLSQQSAITYQFVNAFSTSMEIEEV